VISALSATFYIDDGENPCPSVERGALGCAIYAQFLSVQIRLNDVDRVFGSYSLLAFGQRASSEDDLLRTGAAEQRKGGVR
jgi:hypothetical protein